MKPGAQVITAAATRLFAPLIALFAFLLLATGAAGAGVGLAAGFAFGLILVLHALLFGAAAARAALPPAVARVLLVFGVAATMASGGLHGLAQAPQIIEAGVFVATVASAAIVIQVLFGRVPTLRDEGR